MQDISVKTLHDHLSNFNPEKELIVDVRTFEEYASGHLPGAVHRPLSDILTHTEEFKEYDTVYVHCKTGGRSSQACEMLEGTLRNVVNVDGGVEAWVAAGYELEK